MTAQSLKTRVQSEAVRVGDLVIVLGSDEHPEYGLVTDRTTCAETGARLYWVLSQTAPEPWERHQLQLVAHV